MRAIDIDYFVKEWMPKHLEWDFYDMDTMYYDEQWQAELPIIEAEPIRHGHWIKGGCTFVGVHKVDEYICSRCDYHTFEAGNYCGNCSAKMDEVIDNEKRV